MYSVDSASACVEAAEALWPGQGCYGQTWSSLIQAVDYSDQPQGCMKQLSEEAVVHSYSIRTLRTHRSQGAQRKRHAKLFASSPLPQQPSPRLRLQLPLRRRST